MGLAHTYDLYRDIEERCKGEIYIGVLGPVRTGKSTLITRIMDELVLPAMLDSNAKARALDELPQSGAGRTITTTEPKFVPNEAAQIALDEDVRVRIRLIDCVGYMVDGASGHMEGEEERMVKTPWFDDPIPFTKAAEIGTDKVMNEHSTIGLVVTTDGSIGELPRNAYVDAERRTIQQLKMTGKPFMVLVNSRKPYSEETKNLANQIAQQYQVTTMPVNCEQLRREDIIRILEQILYEFPVSSMEFYFPKWVLMLPPENPLRSEMIDKAKTLMDKCNTLRDVLRDDSGLEGTYVRKGRIDQIGLSDGVVKYNLEPAEEYYYQLLTDMVGEEITDTYQLMNMLKSYSGMKQEYDKVLTALEQVRDTGYGVVIPDKSEIKIEDPEIIHQGSKYGVKIKAVSPSIHMIRANIETELAPIVGTKEQAEDLIDFITKSNGGDGMWDTNIFGKSVGQMVGDGISSKIASIGPESQEKLQDSMRKIVNESNGGMVCIII